MSIILAEELETELIDDMISFSERVAALNIPLQQTAITVDNDDAVNLDQFPEVG